jgi:hypothetical protein
VRETDWLKDDLVTERVLANLVFDKRWFDNFAAVRILWKTCSKVAGRCESDCPVSDMRRQAQMVEASEKRDFAPDS